MTREQMFAGLQRLFVIQYFKPEEIGPYGEVIFEGCAWMDSYRFDAVVKEVLKTLKTNQRLKPAHFLGAYRQLAEQNGWHRTETKTCASCGGINFVYVWVRDKKGHEFRATKGCPECNQKYSQVHPDFTEIQSPDVEQNLDIERLKKIPPAFAQVLLDTANVARINLKTDMLDALCEAASQPDAKTITAPVRNPTKHRNEMVEKLAAAPPPPAPPAPIAEEEEIPFEPDPAPVATATIEEGVNPNIAHIPKAERERLQKEAEAEEVPF